jgi:AAHS family 4-hydroxybenzoate transporter-like MFS transporter
MCMVSVCANFYETSLRATGIGSSMSVGRIGGIAGPVLAGLLVGAGAGAPAVFSVAAVAALCAAAAITAFGLVVHRPGRAPAPATEDATTNDGAPTTRSGR